MKKYIYGFMGMAALFAGSCGRTVDPNKKPKSSLDSFSYIVGMNLGRGMKSQGLEKIDYSSLIHGIEEGLKKDSGYAISLADAEKIQRAYIMKEQKKKIEKYQADSKKWMADNAKKGGVTTLSSGAQIRMLTTGNGASPQLYDTIEYSMIVRTGKGKEMMNSTKMGGNQKHVLKQIGIDILEEAFQKATAGSEFEVYIQNDMIPQLSGNADNLEDRFGVSIFTFKLFKVIPGKPEPAVKKGMPTPGMK